MGGVGVYGGGCVEDQDKTHRQGGLYGSDLGTDNSNTFGDSCYRDHIQD